MTQFGRFGGMQQLTPIVKNIIIINILVFVAQNFVPQATDYLAMHYPSNPKFLPMQLFTHMFAHGGIMHILFNMYALYSFGSLLERVLPSKRFLMLYFFSGFGAIAFHLLINAVVAYNVAGTINITEELAQTNQTLANIYYPSLVGASGALYGLLAAFAYLFPNTPLMFMFVPVPIKAKYMIPLVILVYDIGFAQYGLDNVAHYAHIGGAIFGFLLMYYWNKTKKADFF
jgi:membrane associated rhomboid family serine protease